MHVPRMGGVCVQQRHVSFSVRGNPPVDTRIWMTALSKTGVITASVLGGQPGGAIYNTPYYDQSNNKHVTTPACPSLCTVRCIGMPGRVRRSQHRRRPTMRPRKRLSTMRLRKGCRRCAAAADVQQSVDVGFHKVVTSQQDDQRQADRDAAQRDVDAQRAASIAQRPCN